MHCRELILREQQALQKGVEMFPWSVLRLVTFSELAWALGRHKLTTEMRGMRRQEEKNQRFKYLNS
jgi:hypothetical protein